MSNLSLPPEQTANSPKDSKSFDSEIISSKNLILLTLAILERRVLPASSSTETREIADNKTQPDRQGKFKLPPGTLLLLSVLLTFWLSPSIRSYWSQSISSTNTNSRETALNLDEALPVRTITVSHFADNQIWRSYTGTVVARRQSSLSLELPGEVTEITVNESDRVAAGRPIAYIDDKKLLIKKQELLARRKQLVARLQELETGSRNETIEVARLNLEDWEYQLELSDIKQQRRQQLYNAGAISLELLNEATTEAKSYEARVKQAHNKLKELKAGARVESIAAQQAAVEEIDATLASLNLDLEKSILKAPFAGTIAQRLVDEGTIVSAGQPIVSLVEQALEARIGVPVAVASQLSPGSEHQLEIGSRNYSATVQSILPQLDSNSRTTTVVFSLDNSATSQVRLGQVAQLKLTETVSESGYWLPTTALTRGINGLWTCYVLGKKITDNGSTAFLTERRHLEVLHTEGDRVLVRGTLQNGDRVIVDGTHRLVPDLLVESVNAMGSFTSPVSQIETMAR